MDHSFLMVDHGSSSVLTQKLYKQAECMGNKREGGCLKVEVIQRNIAIHPVNSSTRTILANYQYLTTKAGDEVDEVALQQELGLRSEPE